MANVIEIAKALITAYNEKNWSKVKDMLAADAVYDEKGTHRQIQGVGEIIDAWQGWAKTIPNSKATFVREFASGDTAIFELVWKGVHAGPLQTPTGSYASRERHRTSRLRSVRDVMRPSREPKRTPCTRVRATSLRWPPHCAACPRPFRRTRQYLQERRSCPLPFDSAG
jgi:ketosteroid isomerase-like protein